MTGIDQLLDVIARFSAATGLSEATISARYLGSGVVVRDLRAGRDMGARRVERMLARFSAEWPAEAEWPADVPRPAASTIEAAE